MGLRTNLFTRMIKGGFGYRFTLARMTRVPMIGQALEWAFFDQDEMIYLPKDSVSSRISTLVVEKEIARENMVLPSQIIDHIIRQSRHVFIMNHCMCREANECSHYPHELGCIFLGAGTTRIPSKMGRMATAEEGIEHMRRARDAGLVHLIGRNKIDSVWLNTGPKEDLLSICNCCECCCLWKMIPHLSASISSTVTRMPGVRVDTTTACTGCGKCGEGMCFVDAISMVDKRASIDQDRCKGCGRCVDGCPFSAIVLTIEDNDFYQRTIEKVEPLVDLRKA